MTGEPSPEQGVRFTSVPIYAPRRPKVAPLRLSPTSIAVFRQCRQHYKFRYVDKLGDQYGKAKPYYTMANHVHATLKDFLTLLPLERRTMETIEQLLRNNWRRYRIGFRGRQDEKRWADKALAQLRAFVTNHDVTVNPLMVEAPLEAEITLGLILHGRVDRVDREADGTLHIIDYKTGNMPIEPDWTQVQLHAVILSRRMPWPVSKASYLYLEPSVLRSADISASELERVRWELLGAAREVRRERRYRPTPGLWCSGCDFLPICPSDVKPQPLAETQGQLELWDEFLDYFREGG